MSDKSLDPRARRTRQQLQQAMNDLMQESDFQKISINDITERAGVNRATFYAHFQDKHDLLNANVKDYFKALLQEKLEQAPAFTLDNLRVLTLITSEFVVNLGSSCMMVTLQRHLPVMIAQLQDNLHQVILDWLLKSPRPVLAPEVIAMTSSAMIFGSVMQWVKAGRPYPAEQLTEQILSVMNSGLHPYLVDTSIAAAGRA
jgi:AcrR family transcriptional regulator